MSITSLNREIYTISGAARLLNMPVATLTYWLEGGERNGRHYLPVLREAPTGSRHISWGEFVEAGLLRQYRRRKVSMEALRGFISILRERFGVPFPLAHSQPFTSGKHLVWEAQQEVFRGEDPPFVAWSQGEQYLLLPAADAFLKHVEFNHNYAARWRPLIAAHDVVLDPEYRFGAPSIGGIGTAAVRESAEDVGVEETAELFGLSVRDVHQALAYEQWTLAQAA